MAEHSKITSKMVLNIRNTGAIAFDIKKAL